MLDGAKSSKLALTKLQDEAASAASSWSLALTKLQDEAAEAAPEAADAGAAAGAGAGDVTFPDDYPNSVRMSNSFQLLGCTYDRMGSGKRQGVAGKACGVAASL